MGDWNREDEETMIRPIPPRTDEETMARPLAPREEEKTSALTNLIKGPVRSDETVMMSVAPTDLGYLVEASGIRAGLAHRLGHETVVGRESDRVTILVDDQTVSKTHAKIRLEDHRFVLYDLASKNGTSVTRDGQKQSVNAPFALTEGDYVELGKHGFIFMEVSGS